MKHLRNLKRFKLDPELSRIQAYARLRRPFESGSIDFRRAFLLSEGTHSGVSTENNHQIVQVEVLSSASDVFWKPPHTS